MKKFNLRKFIPAPMAFIGRLVVSDICFRMRRKYSGKSTGNFQKDVS